MRKTQQILRDWLPVLLWMLFIFGASTDALSFQRSSRFLGPFFRWLVPGISDAALHASIVAVRKCGHVAEYGVLALLCWHGLRRRKADNACLWDWRLAGKIVLLVMAYAATDEFHQTFVPSRQGSLLDVLLDTSGGVLALLFLWSLGRWRRRW